NSDRCVDLGEFRPSDAYAETKDSALLGNNQLVKEEHMCGDPFRRHYNHESRRQSRFSVSLTTDLFVLAFRCFPRDLETVDIRCPQVNGKGLGSSILESELDPNGLA